MPKAGDSPDIVETIRQLNALMSAFMGIPFPEELTDETWVEKVKQLEWLADNGLLGIQKVK